MSDSSRSTRTAGNCPACRSTNVGGDACYDCGSVWNLTEIRESSALRRFVEVDDYEPDWEQIAADRAEARFDEDAAQDRYDNSIYGP